MADNFSKIKTKELFMKFVESLLKYFQNELQKKKNLLGNSQKMRIASAIYLRPMLENFLW